MIGLLLTFVHFLIMNFAAFLMCAMTAGAIFVTVGYGEENYFAIRRVMKIVHRWLIITSIAFSILMIIIAPAWVDIYGVTDPLAISASIFAGRIVPITYILVSVVYTYTSFYSAVGKPFEGNLLTIAYSLIGPLVIALPLGLTVSFNAMSVGFSLTPVFSIAVLFVCCLIKGNVKKLPYLLPDDNKINFHYDLKIEDESIIRLRDAAGNWLEE